MLIEMISFACNTGRTLAAVIESRDHATREIGEQIIRVANAYAARKEERGLLDFDDLLVKWRDLLDRNEDVREFYAGRLRHILVDEYQDTNALQGRIVDLLASAHRNVLVVGDDAQSIYAFRGAHFENIMQFPKRYPEARTFRLETNYRSAPEILSLANASIRGNEKQFRKTLRAERPAGAKPAVVSTNDLAQQAQFVTQRVRELHDGGASWAEMAVLYRAHYNSMELQMELTRHGIPFVVRSGIRFFEQAHIKDALSYLRIVHNPRDELSWKRVVRLYPKVGDVTAQKIWGLVGRSDDPLAAARSEAAGKAVPKAAQAGWKRFTALLDSLRRPETQNHPGEQIRLVLRGGYQDYLGERYTNAETRTEDLEQLARFAEPYEKTADFLSEVTLQSTAAGESTTIEGDVGQDAIVLSTIHQAKGLEWKVVFIIGLVDGKFPDGRSVSERDKLEEERRLFYVACTRAKDLLTLCYPLLMREQKWDAVQRRSRFIDELDPKLYEEWSVATESGWEADADGDGFDDLRGRPSSRRGWLTDGGGDTPLEDMEDEY
ncbi:MAG: ATP-dependent helicase [Planctomycetes bacterium]|nr:ATP-dependent helicase [Planctomycetota bacterium]